MKLPARLLVRLGLGKAVGIKTVDTADFVRDWSQWVNSTYTVADDGESILCHICGSTSFHPRDVAEKYCGQCHVFHDHLIDDLKEQKP